MKNKLLIIWILLIGWSCPGFSQIYVTNTNDAGAGSLRQAIINANAGVPPSNIISTVTGKIILASSLPAITKAVSISGNNMTVSGNNLYSVFAINNTTVTINNLVIADGYAKGGNGVNAVTSGAGGGGGAGLGGGLAVLGSGSNVTLNSITFTNNNAIGGDGGKPAWNFSGNGGAGGVGNLFNSGTAGTGGVTTGGNGGAGGLFSGGGGAGNSSGTSSQTAGGSGGLFAGGGGMGIPTSGLNTGVCPPPIAPGGQFAGDGGWSCGGSNPNGGGGGAGLGGALFVYQGTATINNVSFNNNSAAGGAAGDNANDGQGKGAAIFVYTGATLITSGTNTFNGNVAADGLCTAFDNKAYCNANGSGPQIFPAQSEYELSLSIDHTNTSAALTWNFCGSEAITQYVLERSVNDTLNYTPIATQATSTYSDNLLFANNTYFYRVKGTTQYGSSNEYSYYVVSTYSRPGSGNAVIFDGVNDHLQVRNLEKDFSSGITLSIWVFPTAANNYARFFDLGNGQDTDNIYIYRNGTSNDIQFKLYLNSSGSSVVSVSATNAIELNKWQHFACVYNPSSNQASIYKNGVLIAQITKSGVPPIVERKLCYIGRSNWASDGYYKGMIDEATIWNRPLSQTEIQTYMCQKLQGNETGLVTNLRMDEGTGYGLEKSGL